MSQVVYRGNLSAKAFPFLTDFQGRTVIVPGNDNTFNRAITANEDLDKDAGIPAIYYCHNVLPAPYGFSSVGYQKIVEPTVFVTTEPDFRVRPYAYSKLNPITKIVEPPPPPSPVEINLEAVIRVGFEQAFLLRANPLSASDIGPRYYFALTRLGDAYSLALGRPSWSFIQALARDSNTVVTTATVQGISYIYLSGRGCYKYNAANNSLISVTLTGLVAGNIIGIAAYQGYFIAYDQTSIYWSSLLDIDYTLNSIDFVPSLITGAGNINPEGARGPINLIKPSSFGLSIYTTSNIVSAVYSGNSRYPFNFKEVISSGGCSSANLVCYDANGGAQYAYTTSGLQLVNSTTTSTVFPEITDFVAGENFEDFDEVSQTFVQYVLNVPMQKKLAAVADRYLVFSYGITSLTHAIIYDMSQKRFGKLKYPHVDVFEYEYADTSTTDAPRKSIAFLAASGEINVLNPSSTFGASNGVILLGKFQLARSRVLTLEGLEIQTVHPNQSVSAYALSSNTGGTMESVRKVQGYEVSTSGQSQRIYNFHTTAVNHSILLIGGFFLSSFILKFHIHGRR